MADSLFLGTPASGSAHPVKVSPTAILSILDHYVRRPEDQDRVFGTLLGVVNEAGEIEVRNSFPVPHSFKDGEIYINKDFHTNMAKLHRNVNSKELIIGWYSSSREQVYYNLLIHNFYTEEVRAQGVGKELQYPIQLTVDTALTGDRMDIKAYTSTNVGQPSAEKVQSFMLVPVPCDIKVSDGERIGLDLLSRAKRSPASLSSELDTLERNVLKLKQLLEKVQRYVADVASGKQTATVSVGRYLMDTVAAVPKIDQAKFEQIFNSNLQDLLMVVYLSTLTRTQLSLAERLQLMP